ncbi:MAG: patatin-like phospholipase family protein, partial [Cyanobacteria bacterium P01_A01_bin.84]
MTQKLAIVISGAVSLGSYEAGVLYEIIEAIAQHNQHPDTTDEEKIEIDVITGASAGAMSACILAQKLLFDGDALRRDPYNNDLHNAWVKDVDIEEFLQIKETDNPIKFLLSSQKVKEIGYKYLLGRYDSTLPTPQKIHPGASPDGIHLGIAMSNLNGFDFEQKSTEYRQIDDNQDDLSTNSSLKYTQHKDCFTIKIKPDSDSDQKSIWEKIEKVGRSSGAFPFAFSVVDIERDRDDDIYKDAINLPENPQFTYTDGSVFENEPLGIAKSLVNQIDIRPTDYENRFYLYVAPGLQEAVDDNKFDASSANYITTGLALARAIFNQARFQDWIRTEKINQSIRKFDRQAIILKEVLEREENQYLQEKIDEVFTELLKVLHEPDDPPQNIDLNRLQEQFQAEYNSFNNSKLAHTWMKIVRVLEKAAKLGDRDIMKIYAITATREELIGEELSAFIGFFDERFRQFDYNTGRKNAIESLRKIQEYSHYHGYQSGINDNLNHKEIYIKNFNLPEIPSSESSLHSVAAITSENNTSENNMSRDDDSRKEEKQENAIKAALNEIDQEKLQSIANKFANILSQLIYTLLFGNDSKNFSPSSGVSERKEGISSITSNFFTNILESSPFKFLKEFGLRLIKRLIEFIIFQ